LKSIKLFDKSFTKDHKNLLNCAIVNVTPLLKVKQLKQKNKRLQIKEFPFITNNKSRISFAIKFFLNKTKSKKETKMYKTLVTELLAVATNSGKYMNKKKDLYEYAYLKKKYFYYRWF
jgi:ribosomal protein S7